MLLIDYSSIRGGEISDYAKKSTWKLLREYIDSHCKIWIYECPGDGVQDIPILKYQYANMNFAEHIIYSSIFQQVLHKCGDSAIIYIKIFQNSKDLAISVGNSYNEDQLINTFFDNL